MSHLLPDLGAGAALVRERICWIAELIHIKGTRDFRGQVRRHVLVIFRMTARDVGSCQPHFGAERADMSNFFLRHFVGDNKNEAISFRAGDQGEAESGVPCSSFDDRAAGLQFPIPFRRFNHR